MKLTNESILRQGGNGQKKLEGGNDRTQGNAVGCLILHHGPHGGAPRNPELIPAIAEVGIGGGGETGSGGGAVGSCISRSPFHIRGTSIGISIGIRWIDSYVDS